MLIKQEKLEGGLYPDGLLIGCIFLFACRWPVTGGVWRMFALLQCSPKFTE